MITWKIIYFLSIILIGHSYVLYPWILQILSSRKKENDIFYDDKDLPRLTIIMSVYNEEKILERKLNSILDSNYPQELIQIMIGSDASNDNTNEILERYSSKYDQIQARIFENRQGKPAVINKLVAEADTDLLLLTDAKVIFHPEMIGQLSRHFKNEDIGAVGANILNERIEKDGVSIQEKAFMTREILMKYREGLIWGACIGVYGAVYAIRKSLFTPVPSGFAVDDFFISMNVLRKKHKVLMDLSAISYENVPNLITEEYRRKVRIATGNFYNMKYFAKELFTPWKGSSFAYISHKAIRWIGPLLFILFMLSNIFLYKSTPFYTYTLYAAALVLCFPIIDLFLSKIGIHIVLLRFVRHFITMNLALLNGLLNYLGGRKKDVWQPTKR